jgi:RimJ/RimL family protein N-acetyltransferase
MKARVGIRRFRTEDATPLFEAVRESITELSVWMPWCHAHYTIGESATFVQTRDQEWENGEHFSFVIHDGDSGVFLGGVGLNFRNRVHNFANLGYWVRSRFVGRGVATAAVRLAAQFAFKEIGLQRVEIVIAVGNLASQRVAGKAGAKREGVLRRRLLLRDQPLDAVMFSLLPEDLNE